LGIRVLTLGGLHVFRDGEELASLPGKHTRCALLTYLAVERSATRETLLALLWPEKDPDKARHTLSQTLYELRQELGAEWVATRGDEYRATGALDTDIQSFQRDVGEGKLEDALEKYSRPFLEGVHLVSTHAFESWVDRVRSRMERLQRKAYRQLLEHLYGSGEILEARNRARSWVEKAPLDDEAQNWLIRLLTETGQRSEALKHYESFRVLLAKELEVEPLEETQELVRRIREGGVALAPSTPVKEPLRVLPGTIGDSDAVDQFQAPLPERLLRRAEAHYRKLVFAGIIIFALWGMFGPHGPRVDPFKLICFPPTLGGTIQVQTQDVCQSIQVAMEDAEPLIFQSGFPYLTPRQREDPNTLSLGEAQTIALQQQAGFFLLPSLTAEGDSLLVTLALHESKSGVWVRSGHGAGTLTTASSGQIAARAMVGVFPAILDPGQEVELTFITDRDPGAVALWLEGERAYRNLQFDLAYERLSEAVRQDSLLARAALKGALAAGWRHRNAEAEVLVEVALAHRELLPPRYILLAQGLEDYYLGHGDSAVAHFEEALGLDPEWNEAWISLGETYQHYMPSRMDVPESAFNAFRKAMELNPGYLPPLIHLAEQEIREGKVERAQRLLDRITQANPDLESLVQLRYALECVARPFSDIEWEERARSDPLRVLLAGSTLASQGAQLACAEGAFRAILSVRPEMDGGVDHLWGGLIGLSGVLLAQGRDQEAADVLAHEQDQGEGAAPFLFLFQARVAPALDSLCRSVADIAPGIFGPDLERMDPQSGWAIASWHAQQGHREELARLTRRMMERAAERPESERWKWYSLSLQGQLALLEGDTAQAIELLSAIKPEFPSVDWGIPQVMATERLLLAELQLATGHYPNALRTAEYFDHPAPNFFLAFIPESLAIRIQAAEALGFHQEAEEYRERLRRMGREELILPGP
jgi:DNA-binding SARP family transcriptional activator